MTHVGKYFEQVGEIARTIDHQAIEAMAESLASRDGDMCHSVSESDLTKPAR